MKLQQGLTKRLAIIAGVAAIALSAESTLLHSVAAPANTAAAGKTALTKTGAPPAAAKPAVTGIYARGKAALAQKNYKEAAKHFETAMAENPSLQKSCECRMNLGKSLCSLASAMPKGCPEQTATYKKGAAELRKAIRIGRGSTNAVEANKILMALPPSIIAPKTGEDTPLIALANGIRGLDRGSGEESKAKILEFYASWCEPCKQLKPLMEKVKSQYGDQVEVISYNVDDPEVEKVVEDYEVSPIPTLIFLDTSNQVVTYSIGFSGEAGLQKGLKKILAKS